MIELGELGRVANQKYILYRTFKKKIELSNQPEVDVRHHNHIIGLDEAESSLKCSLFLNLFKLI